LSLSLRFPHQNHVYEFSLPQRCYMPRPPHSSRFYHPNNILWAQRSLSSSLCSCLQFSVTTSLLDPNIFRNILFSNTLSVRTSFNVSDKVSHPYKTTGKIIILYILIFVFHKAHKYEKLYKAY
jgi:hypothetical protein